MAARRTMGPPERRYLEMRAERLARGRGSREVGSSSDVRGPRRPGFNPQTHPDNTQRVPAQAGYVFRS